MKIVVGVIEFGAVCNREREFILLLLSVFWRVIVAEVLELIFRGLNSRDSTGFFVRQKHEFLWVSNGGW